MCAQRKGVQRLLERLPAGVQRTLGLRVLRVAVRIDLVAAGAEERRGEELGRGGDEVGGEGDGGGGSNAQLAGGGFLERVSGLTENGVG